MQRGYTRGKLGARPAGRADGQATPALELRVAEQRGWNGRFGAPGGVVTTPIFPPAIVRPADDSRMLLLHNRERLFEGLAL